MLLNKKGDVEEIEFAGKYGKVFESIHDFLDPEPAEWTKVEKEADGYDKIIDKTIQALNEAKEKKTFWEQEKEYKECEDEFVNDLHFKIKKKKK